MSSREYEANSDSRNDTRLSITFLLEDRPIISSFFLEDHDRNSKTFLEDRTLVSKFFLEHLTCVSNFFPGAQMRVETHLNLSVSQWRLRVSVVDFDAR